MTFGDFNNKTVLITGGTRGIGLACGLAFARRGARAILTHKWGSADEDGLRRQFAELGAPEPLIVEADAGREEDTTALLERVRRDHDGVDVFISNVCVVVRGEGPLQHSKRALFKSLEYSSWPFVGHLHAIKKAFGRYPGYAVAMSSDGPDTHYPAYDYVAVAKAVLETFVRYMNTHLIKDGCKVNALRTRQVMTESYAQMFGPEQVALARNFAEFACTVEEVADTTLALCSGMFDAMGGQVVMLDRGAAFVDNVATMGPRLLETAKEDR
ncbi:MAG: SDR family oxidoreductase [Myxococcales bacterium]|jgi:NAD(P)-dependent dehydrogenase (short-subunit alcohol dehydrogenase family)|nr:SDR family oxidoreductase [Myxococcales bacterium]